MVRVVLAVIVGVALGISGTLAYPHVASMTTGERKPPTTQPALSTPATAVILALGTIEPRHGVVNLASPMVGSTIREIKVVEGQTVKAEELLIVLDDAAAQEELKLAESLQHEGESRLASEKELAAERVAVAELAVKQLAESKPLQLDSQEAQLQILLAKRRQAEKDVTRLEELKTLPNPLATEQQVDYQRVALEAATAEQNAAQVGMRQLAQSLQFSLEKAEAELRAARTSLQQLAKDDGVQVLQRRTALARRKLEQLVIKAPTDGTVLALQAHVGELVAQQPLLQLADLSNLVCIAEVDAGAVRDCSTDREHPTPAHIRCRALGDVTLSGKVERIGNSAARPNLQFADPRQQVDRSVAKVTIGIDERRELLPKDLTVLIGLQVEVKLSLTDTPNGP